MEPELVNCCVIAHIDHGKTTFCDHLVASNDIIPKPLAGSERFLDFRSDEKERFVTIQNSLIRLLFRAADSELRLTLIDSPGHVDFSTEVQAATLLSDCALLIVDVTEGLKSKTKAVLQLAVTSRLPIFVVFNKVDRLFTDMNLQPSQAAAKVFEILSSVHSCFSTIQSALHADAADSASELLNVADVVFCSAFQGWAFTVASFAEFLQHAYPEAANEPGLTNFDFWFKHSLTKKGFAACDAVQKSIASRYLFAFLHSLFAVVGYEREERLRALQRVVERLQLELELHDLTQAVENPYKFIGSLLETKYSLPRTIYRVLQKNLPSTAELATQKLSALSGWLELTPEQRERVNRLQFLCVVTGFKLIDESRELFVNERYDGELDSLVLGCHARVIHGTVEVGDAVRVLNGNLGLFTVNAVYCINGLYSRKTSAASAGAIVTLSLTCPDALPLRASDAYLEQFSALVRKGHRTFVCTSVDEALSCTTRQQRSTSNYVFTCYPQNIESWRKFLRAMNFLQLCEFGAAVTVSSDEAQVAITCAGELHFQKLAAEIANLYCCNMHVVVKNPFHSIRETVVPWTPVSLCDEVAKQIFPPWSTDANVTKQTPDSDFQCAAFAAHAVAAGYDPPAYELALAGTADACAAFRAATAEPRVAVENFVCAGSTHERCCNALLFLQARGSAAGTDAEAAAAKLLPFLLQGFRQATSYGPLCAEPVYGVAWFVSLTFDATPLDASGALTSVFSKLLTSAMLARGCMRIYELCKHVEVRCSYESIGRVSALVAQYGGKVLAQDMCFHSSEWILEVHILSNQFNSFQALLHKQTSGHYSAAEISSFWQFNLVDPFAEFIAAPDEATPKTNAARKAVNTVRLYKGLKSEKKLIAGSSDKQKTLGKN